MWKYIQDKNYAILAAMLRKRSYFVEKVSPRLPGLECSYGKIFIPVTEISVAKTGISVTGVSPASHMNTSKFLRRKECRGEISETELARLTGLARLPGRILLSVHMGNFNPVDRDEIQETQPKWWNINLYRSRLSQLCGLL